MGLFSRKKKKREDLSRQEKFWDDGSNYSRYESLDSGKEEEEISKEEEKEFEAYEEEVYLRDKSEKLSYAESCCEEIVEGSKRLSDAKKEYRAVNGYLEDIRLITESEQNDQLAFYARRILNLKNDRESYRTYGTKLPESKYRYIQANEKEMPVILKELHEDESYLQALKTDLHNIEGEKAGLTYERQDCQKKTERIRNLSFAVLAAAALVLGGMFYFHLNSDYDFTIGILGSIAVLAAAVAAMVLLYQKNIREIRLTERKMNKAVGLLNKYRLLYVNVKNRVDYTYRKIGIHNSYELNNYWRLYLTAKKEEQAYSKMSDELYEAQKKYTELIHALNLYDESVWSYQMDAVTEESAMKELVDNLNRRKKGLRKTMDYNRKRIDKCKQKVKELIKNEPSLAQDILKIVEDKENSV